MAEGSQQSQKRINHTWTAEEDKVLVECLSELGSCWKGDNSFKAGYSAAVEKMMHLRIPGCSLRSIPHITSRVKLLKKQYNAIHDMVGGNGGSGFGWNDAKKMIDVEKEIFDDWVKSHHTAKGLYNKPFPHYEALGIIFGNDVASGGNSECPQESVTHLESQHAFVDESGNVFDEYLDQSGDYIPAPCQETEVPENVTEEQVEAPSISVANARKGKKRQRTPDPVVVEVVGVMNRISQNYEKTTNTMDKLVACFEQQHAGSNRRMSIITEIEKFEDLTMEQMLHVAVKLGKDSNLTDIFMQCDDGKRRCMLSGLLSDYI
ncbi:uncharacterized protein LOC133305087 isoform X2 [Gastrolobium bilobum]|uniref:uncharacterized protein LOC133305087 isoform X2 n=1 Tax=Gastrolobium bilobum TaxID=150636 RepID=UPI002AB0E8E4|nr:uncharacterized protein LOC133305087 isoform X2 [Gastrolobium bilobum]